MTHDSCYAGEAKEIKNGAVYSFSETTQSSIEPKNKINWKQPTLSFKLQKNGNKLKFGEGSYFEPPKGQKWSINNGVIGMHYLTANLFPIIFALKKII